MAGGPAHQFLNLLWGGKPEHLHILIWTHPAKTSYWFQSPDSAATKASELGGNQNVYIGVGLAPHDAGPSNRCDAESVAALAGLWVDIDIAGNAHQAKALPATIDEALKILPAGMPPTVVVSTGNGIHCWWLFKEPWVFDGAEDRTAAAKLAYRWQGMLRLNAAAHGWSLDHTHDLARVMRVPGTLNHKQSAGKLVALVSSNGPRYPESSLEEYLDEQGIPHDFAPKTKKMSAADHDLVVDTAVIVDPKLIQEWCEVDARFRATWARQRWDLHNGDPSQSHYDLALANLGLDAGLPEQVIVNLMIQHRREGAPAGHKIKARPDYYRNTLDRAYQRGAGAAPVAVVRIPTLVTPAAAPTSAPAANLAPEPGQQAPAAAAAAPPSPSAAPATTGAPVRPEISAALGCRHISDMLGIDILRILKINGKHPSYVMELRSGKLEFPEVRKLVDQTNVRMSIAAHTNQWVRRFKAKEWEQIVVTMLASLTEVDGGEELTFEGGVKSYLQVYLSETQWITDFKGRRSSELTRPMLINDGAGPRVCVHSLDIVNFCTRSFGLKTTIREVATGLAAIGAASKRMRAGRLDQDRWMLPTLEFAAADYDEGKAALARLNAPQFEEVG